METLLQWAGVLLVVYAGWSLVLSILQVVILYDAGWRSPASLWRDMPPVVVNVVIAAMELVAGVCFVRHRSAALPWMLIAQVVILLNVLLRLGQYAMSDFARYFPWPSAAMPVWQKFHPFAVVLYESRPAVLALAMILLCRGDAVRGHVGLSPRRAAAKKDA